MKVSLFLLSSFLLSSYSQAYVYQPKPTVQAFMAEMRDLWEDHIQWTREYIIAAGSKLPEKDAALKRLLKNQSDIGNAFKPYYGPAAGDKLTALLMDHIKTAGTLISDLMANNVAAAQESSRRWYANADEIAKFLSEANPSSWPLSMTTPMMHSHLDATAAEAGAYLKGNWQGSIDAYEKVHALMMDMADFLSAGLIKQFPDMFIP